jgi:phosphoribosylformimino-5-aminoimidazole carboxamide ribotide isomerase
MQIIPVIDLMDGLVVHAKQGQREAYQPIQSPLCQDASPHAVIDGLLGLHGFSHLYIADLDALRGKGHHRMLLERLQDDYPGLRFWIDQGLGEPIGRAISVIGSESLIDQKPGQRLAQLRKSHGEFILSLDFIEGRLLGRENLLDDSGNWPQNLIIMSLSLVGANAGPDFQRLAQFRELWPEKDLFAAGGVRNVDDLQRLEQMGVKGALIASALHSGAVDPAVLRKLA